MTKCAGCPFPLCVSMPLKDPAKQYDLVIVSESPHLNDLNNPTILQGTDGGILRKAWRECIGDGKPLDISGVYATSAIACLPPTDTKNSTNLSTGLAACQERLFQQLQMAQPKVIFAMGNSALRSIMKDPDLKVTSLLGQVLQSEFGPVIPSIAPAAVEHVPKNYPIFKQSVQQLFKFIQDGKHFGPGEVRYKTLSREDIPTWVEGLRNKPTLAMDIETEGFDRRIRRAICLGISWEKNKAIIINEENFDLISELFTGTAKQLWHNGKFDVHFMRFRYGLQARVDHDTLLLHYLLDEVQGTHDLEQLAMRYLGAEKYEHDVRQYLDMDWGYKYAPRKYLNPYLARDCDYTLQLFDVLYKEVSANAGLLNVYNNLMIPGSEFLLNLENNGLLIDKDRLAAVKSEFEQELEKVNEEIQVVARKIWNPELYKKQTGSKSAPTEFMPSSPKQLKWIIYDRLQLTSTNRRAKKDTRESTLVTLVPKHPLIEAILKYRSLAKIYSTYVIGIEDRIKHDGRIRSTFKLFGTVTGRLSSTDPNMQNIPREGPVKSQFIAAPGQVLIEADYSGIELRVLAVVSNDRVMRQVFIDGRDLHDETTRGIFGPDFTQEQRVKVGKAVNFGIMYGMQEQSLAEKTGKTKPEAAQYLLAWKQTYPEAWAFIEKCRREVHTALQTQSITGRMRRFHHVPKHLRNAFENEATNFPIQGPASDCTLTAGIRLEPLLRTEFDSYVCNIVHDALYVYAPDSPERLQATIFKMNEIMCAVPGEILKTDIPFEAEFKVGRRWSEMKKVKDTSIEGLAELLANLKD